MASNTQGEIAALIKELGKTTQNRKRLRLLSELCEKFYLSDTVVALDYAEQAAKIARKINDPDISGKTFTLLGRCQYRTSDFQSAKENFVEAMRIQQQLHNEQEVVKLYYLMGNIHLSRAEYSQAIQFYNDSLDLAERLQDKSSKEIALNNLGLSYRAIGDLYKSFDYHSRSLELSLELELEGIGPGFLNIAILYYEMHQYDKASEYFDKAYEAGKKNGDILCIVKALLNKGEMLVVGDNITDALTLYDEALAVTKDHDFHSERAKALEHLGFAYAKNGAKKKALESYNEALAFCEQHELVSKVASILMHKAQLLFDMKDPDAAREAANKAIAMASESGELITEALMYRLLAQCDKRVLRFEAALQNYEKYNELLEQTHHDNENSLMREAHIRLEVEAALREHFQLKLQKGILEQDLHTKRQELTAIALQLAKQNEALGKVTSQLKDTLHSPGQKTNLPVSSVISDIERLRNSESEWEFFRTQFDAIHADFGTRLLEKYPALSPKEVKVCLLMKLNLATKDIANSLCLSHRTIEVHRYQIRKKLGLSGEDNLQTFLMSLT